MFINLEFQLLTLKFISDKKEKHLKGKKNLSSRVMFLLIDVFQNIFRLIKLKTNKKI